MPNNHTQTVTLCAISKEIVPTTDEKTSDHELDSPTNGDETANDSVQAGVLNAEAVTSSWSARSLYTAYSMIWLIYFVQMLQSGVTSSLLPYVTSTFASHSLTPTVSIFSSIIAAVLQLTLAKVLDIWGRPQGYLASVVVAILGIAMMAACTTVEMYAAAQVFYTLGNNCIQYSLSIFIADTTSLKSRGLMTALLASSPNIITIWLAGPISNALLNGPGWRWGFGAFAIIQPVVTLPLFGLFIHNFRKSKETDSLKVNRSSRTTTQSIIYYYHEFDAFGLLLLSAGLVFLLLPFNIYALQAEGWRAPLVICLLVLGIVLIIVFILWEKHFAVVTFFPYSLLSNRTVFGAYIMGATLFFSYYSWASYFTSFLQVVNELDVTQASYVSQTYSVGSSLWGILTGYLIQRTGRYKPVTLYFALPLSVLSVGLMINFLQPGSHNVGYIVMCQIFVSFAAGTIIITDGLAAIATVPHQYLAVVLAVNGVFAQVGGAIGLTVSSAIWQNIFPVKLATYLPPSELPSLLIIYGDLTTQLSYPVGSEARLAIQYAYADAQKFLLIAGTAIWVVGFAAVLFWRDIDVRKVNQIKGQVV